MDKVRGIGDDKMGENPAVHPKADKHGMPGTPGKVMHPGGEAPMHFDKRHAPSSVKHMAHGTVSSYAPNHPAMGDMYHGNKSTHSNDVKKR